MPPAFPLAWASEWGEDGCGLWQAFTFKDVRYVLRWIPPGTFWMGSPEDEPGRFDNETRHRVTLTQGFWLGQTAVPQALWLAVMGENPSHFKGEDLPVEEVSWDDCQAFLQRLNQFDDGLDLCLPTEAQWEYACRAGTETPFHFGTSITTDQVNYNGRFPLEGSPKGKDRGKTVPVDALPGNAWGLQQMHGNVWEWCQDYLASYAVGDQVDPGGPGSGTIRVLRGGSWFNVGRDCRSANRYGNAPGYRIRSIGFRLARGPLRSST
jgi:formylglycine-generating enzyme required for sulfatase activity